MLPVLFLYSCGTRFARNCRTFRRAACRSAKPRVAATSSPFPRLLFGGLQVSSLFPMRQALSRSLSFGGLRASPADYCTDSQGRPHSASLRSPVTAVSFPMFPAAGNTRSGFATAPYKRATPALPTTTNVKNPNKT